MRFLTKILSFDVTSSKIKIVRDGKVVLSEKTQLSIDENGRVIAFGDDVTKQDKGTIISPIRGGLITDFNAFEQLLRSLIKKVLNKNGAFTPSLKAFCTIPDYASEVDMRAIRDSFEHAGAREVYMIFSSHCINQSAVTEKNDSFLIIDSGADKVSFSIMANDKIHASIKLDFGAEKLKRVLWSKLKSQFGLDCKMEVIEELLHNYVTFNGSPKRDKMTITATNENDLQSTQEIDLVYLNNCLTAYFEIIKNEIQMILQDITKFEIESLKFILLTGKLSQLNGFDSTLNQMTNLPIKNKSNEDYALKGLIQLAPSFESNKKCIR
nr:rod shape-determining protein [uncultured Draconibacterium sp.]